MIDMNKLIRDGIVITAGDIDNFNSMVVNWGLYGTIWRSDVFMFFVRPSRYTNEFLNKYDYFTVSFFFPAYRKEISYLGSHSGRDEDKIKAVNFTPVQLENGVGFTQAEKTIVCRKIYVQDMDANNFPNDIKEIFYAEGDVHQLFIGEIVKEYENH